MKTLEQYRTEVARLNETSILAKRIQSLTLDEEDKVKQRFFESDCTSDNDALILAVYPR